MSLTQPLSANTTCDIYRDGQGPPAPPAQAGVACRLEPHPEYSTQTAPLFTHVLLVAPTVDIRDDYPNFPDGRTGDKVYVPDRHGTLFRVVLVRRQLRGTDQDHKRVLLRRQAVNWPSDNV
ncbi:MAG: hypothetical protein NZ700_11440 [Gemmataceae bacterium]|nr:hypothetical protein [Gemmataceae bacterium]MDW8265153.1 hypothetical protein [Gemmataceae bacterium]